MIKGFNYDYRKMLLRIIYELCGGYHDGYCSDDHDTQIIVGCFVKTVENVNFEFDENDYEFIIDQTYLSKDAVGKYYEEFKKLVKPNNKYCDCGAGVRVRSIRRVQVVEKEHRVTAVENHELKQQLAKANEKLQNIQQILFK